MRRLLSSLVALCVAACLLPSAGFGRQGRFVGAAAESSASREGRLRIFDEVWEQVRARYFDPSLRGVDWQGLRGAMRPRAAEARGEPELYAVLREMLGRLRDPHTRVFAPGENTDWRVLRFVSAGVAVRELGGEVVVTEVERGSDAWREGVRASDALLSIGGEAVSALVERKVGALSAEGSPPARRLAVARLFDGEPGTTVTAAFSRAGREGERVVRLRREARTRVPALEITRAGGGVFVLRFNVFAQEIAAQLARAARGELKGARALVIDLRGNGGGETEALTDIASTLLPAGVSLGRFTDREGRVRLEPHTRSAMLSSAGELSRFGGPVVLLTGARTASAAEVFAATLKETARARVLGEQTCGCVLAIRQRHDLPDGGILDISEMDYHTAGGRRLEGSGLAPDEEVEPTREDLRRGRDRALERAAELLKLKLR